MQMRKLSLRSHGVQIHVRKQQQNGGFDMMNCFFFLVWDWTLQVVLSGCVPVPKQLSAANPNLYLKMIEDSDVDVDLMTSSISGLQ